MKAIVQDRYGSPDVLRLADVDKPVPGDDDVLVQVRAAGVDRGVWHGVTGLPYVGRLGFGLRAPRKRPGMDVAGTVDAVGSNVSEFRPGDDVFGTCSETFAEYACARPVRFVAKPANLTFEQAAAVPISALTALHALRAAGQPQTGQDVLVIGAGGGVGTFAVQLAKASGARVTGVCSTSKVDLVRSIGADEVIDYTRDDFADGTRRYDVILDIAGKRSLAQLRRVLAAKGSLVIIGAENGGRWLGGLERNLHARLLSPFIGQKLRAPISLHRKKDLQHMADLIEAGTVTPVVEQTYPLDKTPDAIRDLEQGRVRGKAVVVV